MLSSTKNRDQSRNRQVCLTTPGKPFLVDVVIESNIGREAEVARQEKRK